MPKDVQVGTILMRDGTLMSKFLSLNSDRYSGDWSVVRLLSGLDLDKTIRASGLTFFFMAAEVKATFLGSLRANKIRNAVKRLLGKVEQQRFNGLEVTGIVAKHFLGIPYTVVTAHSRHVQQGCYLQSIAQRSAC